jgi:excisionase family DNA binding protein
VEKLAINVDELGQMLGISRPVAYKLIKREGFPAIRIGQRRILIPVDSLREWLNKESGKLS